MIFPVTATPVEITHYSSVEQTAPINRYPSFETKSPFQSDLYRITEVYKETKIRPSRLLDQSEWRPYAQKDSTVIIKYIDGYSEEFLSFQTESFVRQVLNNLDIWASEGTDDAIPQIAKTKQLLQQYERYLVVNKESRMLLAGLELVFENNAWESLPSEKVSILKNILSRFKYGIEIKGIKTFMTELHTQKISVMDKNYADTQEKE